MTAKSRWRLWPFGTRARGPGDVDAALRSALLALLARDLDTAEELLVRAARLDSHQVEPYLALGRLFRTRGEIGRAIRVHQNLLLRGDLDRRWRSAALEDLAADYRQGGFLRRAIASYEELLEHDPRHAAALRALVQLLGEVREHDRAIALVRRLARIERRDASADEAALLVEMARAAHAEGRSDDARRAVKRALRRHRDSVQAWILLGALEAERGRSKAALHAWARVPVLDARSGPLVYPQLEAAYASVGRSRDYETYLRRLIDERGADSAARLALARTLLARGEMDEAVTELRNLLAGESDHLEARGLLGRVLFAERRGDEANKEYAELLDVLERRGLLRPAETLE